MIRFTAQLIKMRFKRKEYTQALGIVLNREVRNASRAFLRAVLPKIPVDTGMAKASWMPLGRFLRVAVPVHPIPRKYPKRYYDGGRRTSLFQTVESGAMLGEGAFRIIEGSPTQHFFGIEVSTVVDHYTKQDTDPKTYNKHLPPWESMSFGAAAFISYLDAALRTKMPKFSRYIVIKEIKVN